MSDIKLNMRVEKINTRDYCITERQQSGRYNISANNTIH